MSRIDDVRELAEKVMGWNSGPEGSFQWSDTGGRKCQRYNWNPFTCADDALEVVEATIKKTGYRILVGNDGENYCAMFRDEAEGFRDFNGEGTFCEAVCAAALAAIRKGAV